MRLLILTGCVLALCPAAYAAPQPDPDPSAHVHATIIDAPYAYRAGGWLIVAGRPNGYAPGGVVYRYWDPDLT